ncbi:MAG: hypothetical protein V3T17_08525 [Pseudomonadales bacterium]
MPEQEHGLCVLSASSESGSLRSIAGFHNLDTYYIDAEYAEQDVISSHESFHDRFLNETPYGLLQSIVKANQLRVKDETLRVELTLLLNELMHSSQDTHERAATYCSIKAFPFRFHNELLQRTPPVYQAYYQDIADVIDGVFNSTFTQFLVAKTLIELALGAPISLRICELKELDSFSVLDSESPDERWKIIVAHYSYDVMKELLSKLETALQSNRRNFTLPSGFNLQSEAHWEGLAMGVAEQLDQYLEKIVRSWFYEAMPSGFPQLARADWHDVSVQVSNRLEKLTKIRIDVVSSSISIGTQDFTSDQLHSAKRAARSKLKNGRALDLSSVPETADEKLGELLQLSTSSVAITTNATNASIKELHWLVYLPRQDKSAAVARLTHSQFEMVLSLRNRFALSVGFCKNFKAIIVGVERTEVFPWIYERLTNLHFLKLENSTMAIEPNKLVWYMSGDLSSWLSDMGRLGSIQYMPIYPDTYITAGAPLAELEFEWKDIPKVYSQSTIEEMALSYGKGGVLGLTFKVANVPGIFLRLMTSQTSAELLPLLDEFNVVPVPPEERETIGEMVVATLPVITSTWPAL